MQFYLDLYRESHDEDYVFGADDHAAYLEMPELTLGLRSLKPEAKNIVFNKLRALLPGRPVGLL